MRKIILMTSAAIIAPLNAIAQTPTCTATPDCASLGYTEASCPNGGVKCPWGDAWACITSESEICSKYGFKYTCTGTGYAGGAGEACDGKYTACTCSNPYTWKGTVCTCPTTYKYTCTGTGYSGGSGTACSGKYASCKCASGYTWSSGSCVSICSSPYHWNGSNCVCDSLYAYTCTREHETGGQGEACDGKYWYCSCESGYRWDCDKCVLGSGSPDICF